MLRLTLGLSLFCTAIALPAITPEVAAQEHESKTRHDQAEAIARHLHRINARVYGAYWCPHCRDQRDRFGPEDWLVRYGIYLECEPGGDLPASPILCQWNQIDAYPTWVINGEIHTGVLTLERLAELSGFGDL